MNTTHKCPFCHQPMSVEDFADLNHVTHTCRNGACRAYGVTLSPDGWAKLTPEKLETYPRQYAPEVVEKVERPEAGAVTFSIETMGCKTVLWVTGDVKETCHTVYGQADIDNYAAIYAERGYAVQMEVA